jgi:hypothetical protein
MEADQLGRLRDILEASRLIASYMKDTSEAQFRADTQKQGVRGGEASRFTFPAKDHRQGGAEASRGRV